jgi:hypothetical protein
MASQNHTANPHCLRNPFQDCGLVGTRAAPLALNSITEGYPRLRCAPPWATLSSRLYGALSLGEEK